MERILGRYSPYFYALLRIVAGLAFMMHGTQKFFGFPVPGPPALDTLMTVAGVIEIVAGAMIALGIFAGTAAFIASGEMAVAYFIAHIPKGLLPLQNGGEPALLFCFIFLYIASRGSGPLSIDAMMSRDGTRAAMPDADGS